MSMNRAQLLDISRLALLVLCKVVGIKVHRKFMRKEKIFSEFSRDFFCF